MPLAPIVVETSEDAFNTAVHDEWDRQIYGRIKDTPTLFVYKELDVVSDATLVMRQNQYPVNFKSNNGWPKDIRQALVLGGKEMFAIETHPFSLRELYQNEATPHNWLKIHSGKKLELRLPEKIYSDYFAEMYLTKEKIAVIGLDSNEHATLMPFAYELAMKRIENLGDIAYKIGVTLAV